MPGMQVTNPNSHLGITRGQFLRASASIAGKIARRTANHAANWAVNKASSWYHQPSKSTHTHKKRKRSEGTSDRMISMGAGQHGEVEKTFQIVRLYKKPKAKLMPGCFKQKWDYAGSVSSNSGRQNANSLFALNTYSQLTQNTGVGYNGYQSPFSVFDMNPNQAESSTTAPGGLVVRPKMGKAFLKEYDIHMLFTNWGNTEAEVELYVFKNKKLAQISPGGVDITKDDPYNIWNKGYIDMGNSQTVMTQRKLATAAVQGAGANYILYAKPTDSKVLRKYYSIAHHEQFRLPTGQSSRDLTLKIIMNKIYSRDELDKCYQTLSNNATFSPPGGLHVMLVTRGASVGNTTSGAAVVPTSVGWVAEVSLISKSLMDNLSTVRLETYTQTQYADATVNVMNEIDNVVADTHA